MWDQRYSEQGFAYGTLPNDFLKEEFQQIPAAGNVLCLAEGEGRNAVFLARQGFSVTAVDQSSVGLNKANGLAHENGVEINTIQADLATFDLGINHWDGIVSIAAHVPPAIRQDLHSRVLRALKNGGIFLLEAYTIRHLEMNGAGGPPASQKDLFMSMQVLTAELAGLDFIIARELDRHITEGKYHQGHSAVVQLLARKG